jgi:hypothetical protein
LSEENKSKQPLETTSELKGLVRLCPEGCILVAVRDADGWCLTVETTDGEEVAMLAWPETWPERVGPEYMHVAGFKVVPA